MKLPSARWLLLIACLALVLLAVDVALTYTNTRSIHVDTNQVTHTHEVIGALERVLALVTEAESGQRGYIISGEPRYLERYDAALVAVATELDRVAELTSDSSEQQARIPELRQHVTERLDEVRLVRDLRRDDGFEAARRRIVTDVGREQMVKLRDFVAEMEGHEHELLAQRARTSSRTYRSAVLTGLLSGLAAMAAIGAFMLLVRRHFADRAAATREIAEQRERLRTTLASIGDGVITTDVEGRVTGMNPVAESLTGWSLGQAQGQPLDAVFRIVNEDSRLPVENPVTRALRDGIVVGLANHTVLIARDGRERPIDDSAAPIRCKEGLVVGCVLVFRDISERKAAEDTLRDSERRYRAIGEAIDFGVWMCDAAGRNTYVSESFLRLVGLTQVQCSDDGWASVLDPAEAAETIAAWKECVATGGVWDREHRFRGADGQWHSVLARGVPVRNTAGEVVGWAGINLDISRLKHAEDALRDADARKDAFLATLAHELRNPLAPVRNAVQVLNMLGADVPQLAWARGVIDRQIQGMSRLIDDLLDVSRITRDRLELRRERIELADVVQRAVETTRPLIDEHRHALTVRLPDEPIVLDGDFTRLAQVFWNLLNNAAKYTDDGGRIELVAERHGSDVVVSVSDSGIGIPVEQLPTLFTMFAQLGGAVARSDGGLGIGLSLVRRLVEMHGGTIAVSSEGPGRGSRFSVRLPILADAPAPPAAAGSRVVAGHPVSQLRILVVDDSKDAATSMAMLLELMGNSVRLAHDGEEAVQAACEFRPQVVLLDIGLPKMNGYDAARAIRGLEGGGQLLLIAVTGWGQDEDKRKAREAGFDLHLVKPIDPHALMTLLSGWRAATP